MNMYYLWISVNIESHQNVFIWNIFLCKLTTHGISQYGTIVGVQWTCTYSLHVLTYIKLCLWWWSRFSPEDSWKLKRVWYNNISIIVRLQTNSNLIWHSTVKIVKWIQYLYILYFRHLDEPMCHIFTCSDVCCFFIVIVISTLAMITVLWLSNVCL